MLRPLFITQYPSSPASRIARFFRSFSSYHKSRGSQEHDSKKKGTDSSSDSGTIIARPRNTYRPPANSNASESTLDIGPEPPPKDEKYLVWGLSAAYDSGELKRSTFESVREGGFEKSTWRSTFETMREVDTEIDLEHDGGWSPCKLSPSVHDLDTLVRKENSFLPFQRTPVIVDTDSI